MAVFQEANATLFVADYAGVDAAGKINAIGAGFAMAGVQRNGLTAPQHVVVLVDIPGKFVGQEVALSLELREEKTNQAVQLPGPSGQPEAVRIQQLIKVERPQFPGLWIPDDMFSRSQVTIAFENGLPLPAGHMYVWRLDIDGQHRKDWVSRFYIPGPPPGPVYGGPIAPSDIPDIQRP